MPRTFVIDRRFVPELLRSNPIREMLRPVAETIAARAGDLAPDDPTTGPPDLPSSMRADVFPTSDGFRARVVSTNWKAHFWEFGTVRHSARPFLRPAAEEVTGRPLEPPDAATDETGA